MKVLVTGGAGYIGATTVRSLLGDGHQVVVYDNLSTGYREAVAPDVLLVEGDVADRGKLDLTFQEHRPDAVLHFASFIEAGDSMKAPEKYFRNNSFATLTLLESMLANSVHKLIFSSTAALYGEPSRIPIEENDALEPINAYGESKLLVERMLSWFERIHGLRYASLRYFNASGSDGYSGECHQPETHLIPRVLGAAAGINKYASIFGTDYSTPDGTCVRDYIHVSDVAQAHVLALNKLGSRAPLIYNLGNGRGFSVREVIDAVRRVTGRSIEVMETARRTGDAAVLVASSERIRRELAWLPQFPDLDTIIASAWDWMQHYPNGYSSYCQRSPYGVP